MENYDTDEQRVTALKNWWRENGRSVFAGLVIGVVAVVGYQQWTSYKIAQAQTASGLYAMMLVDLSSAKINEFNVTGDDIILNYSSTPYAVLASLAMAKQDLTEKKPDNAIRRLKWVLGNSSESVFIHVARIRLVRVLISTNNIDEAMDVLGNIKDPTFAAEYNELRGDIYVVKKDYAAAKIEYESALKGNIRGNEKREFIEMKLNDLLISDTATTESTKTGKS